MINLYLFKFSFSFDNLNLIYKKISFKRYSLSLLNPILPFANIDVKESSIFDFQCLTDLVNTFLSGPEDLILLKSLVLLDIGNILLILGLLYVFIIRYFISEKFIKYIFSKITFISKNRLDKIQNN